MYSKGSPQVQRSSCCILALVCVEEQSHRILQLLGSTLERIKYVRTVLPLLLLGIWNWVMYFRYFVIL